MPKELIRLKDLIMEFDGERILDQINLYICLLYTSPSPRDA